MKVVIQRVSEASVTIDSQKVAQIHQGLLILVGIESEDNLEDITWLVSKIAYLRIFGDANNVMKKLLQKMVNHLISLKEFKDIDKVDVFFAFTSKHKTAMCQTVYGMKIKT